MGVECLFICRAQPGDLREEIIARGFRVSELPSVAGDRERNPVQDDVEGPGYAAWLGCDWKIDARQTCEALARRRPQWLVVDHYALDHTWEGAVRPFVEKVLAIDDLADRVHDCDLLVDQNLGRRRSDYEALVPTGSEVLAGAEFAMLRHEFASLRPYSLSRREGASLRRVLITMGGVDQANASGLVLQALTGCTLPSDCQITVVLGRHAPWIKDVEQKAREIPWRTEVLVNFGEMARLMSECDLAIGGAGITSWERCCLGLPALVATMAENQRRGAQALHDSHAAISIGDLHEVNAKLPVAVAAAQNGEALSRMSKAARKITDGRGLEKVLAALEVAHA